VALLQQEIVFPASRVKRRLMGSGKRIDDFRIKKAANRR